MNACPVCATEIEESFGLIECPSCHHILFVDIDGSLKLQDQQPPTEVVETVEVVEAISEEPAAAWDEPILPEEPVREKTLTQNKTLQEIQDFADNEKSNLQQGSLFYDVTLYNLDTQEIRDEVKDILQESKFNIDFKKINFKLPQLTIKDLNAVKASVLVTRLKHLPIDIEWTQNSILDGERT